MIKDLVTAHPVITGIVVWMAAIALIWLFFHNAKKNNERMEREVGDWEREAGLYDRPHHPEQHLE